VKVAIFVRAVMAEGGLALASFRLATALVEAGAEAEVLYCAGEPPPAMPGLARRLPAESADPSAPRDLRAALREAAPDVVVVGSEELDDLRAASEVAPTLMHAHLHIGVCADTARYWSRLQRPCGVTAGWKCAALRPVLGCNQLRETLKPAKVAAQKRLLHLLRDHGVGVLCVSTDQAERYVAHGVPAERVAALPNLGIRMSAEELERAAAEVPEEWRSATAYVGRLSKTKGAQLLPDLHRELSAEARLRVFGEGYLEPRLSSLPAEALCGHVDQKAIAGVLMWARAFVFPSLWPEPGGIVGVDAQVMGVPVAAFDIGAGRFWPDAERFRRADVAAMARWLERQPARAGARDPAAVAAAQGAYWSRIGERGARDLAAFASGRGFEARQGGPAEDLIGPGASRR
jgi:glycosyltransferase involved in cell wall biosynthesis